MCTTFLQKKKKKFVESFQQGSLMCKQNRATHDLPQKRLITTTIRALTTWRTNDYLEEGGLEAREAQDIFFCSAESEEEEGPEAFPSAGCLAFDSDSATG